MNQSTGILAVLLCILLTSRLRAEGTVTWDPKTQVMNFELSELTGVLDLDPDKPNYSTHHFSEVRHLPTDTLLSPDDGKMKHVGLLNFFRVLVEDGYLTELRAEKPVIEAKKDGVILTYEPTIRRQAKVILDFTFREPNIIDMDMSVEALANYDGFEVLLSAYLSDGFLSGAYVAEEEFADTTEPEQIRITDQPMIHGVWPFFPRDEAGAHLLTDGRHQKGRWFWRMAIGRRYGLPMAFFSKGDLDVLLMGRPEDVYAVGATYEGDAENDSIAAHRSLYLSMLGEDLAAGASRRTQMRMIVGKYGSDPAKHAELHEQFLKEFEALPRTYYIDPTK